MTRSILVIGAGIVGVCCALSLQKRGLAVTLIDRGSPGRETSYGNAGVLSRISITPINNPGLYGKIPSYLGNKHAALHLNWGRVAKSPEWLLRFLWEARSSQAQQRIEALKRIGYIERGTLREFVMIFLRRYRPQHADRADALFDVLARVRGRAGRVGSRVRGVLRR